MSDNDNDDEQTIAIYPDCWLPELDDPQAFPDVCVCERGVAA